MKRCENWSLENKQCKFNYTPHPWINDKDLDPRCDGYKLETQCAWYKGHHLDIAGNDALLKKFRSRMRGELPKDLSLKNHIEKRDKKELQERSKEWERI